MKKLNRKGFTLIELLVVIAIIGLLSTLAVVALNNARLKARDARRVADVKQIQTALELYLNDNDLYPATQAAPGGMCLSSVGFAAACTAPTYMQVVPTDPDGATEYAYTQDAAGVSYHLIYTLEGATGGIALGTHCATGGAIVDDGGAACP